MVPGPKITQRGSRVAAYCVDVDGLARSRLAAPANSSVRQRRPRRQNNRDSIRCSMTAWPADAIPILGLECLHPAPRGSSGFFFSGSKNDVTRACGNHQGAGHGNPTPARARARNAHAERHEATRPRRGMLSLFCFILFSFLFLFLILIPFLYKYTLEHNSEHP